jgi:DNA mismatch repair protein MutS2
MTSADQATARASLEFSAVLDVIAERAVGEYAASRLRALAPCHDAEWIRTELDRVGELLAVLRRGDGVVVTPVPDLRPALARLALEGSVLELSHLGEVFRLIVAARLLGAELDRVADRAPRLAVLRQSPLDRTAERRLERALGDDGSLRDSASPALAAARREVHQARERLIKRLDAILRDMESRGGVTVRDGRYVIPVRRDDRQRPDGIVHDESASAGTLFVEPTAAIPLGNALRAAIVAEEREVLAVLRELTEMLRPLRAELLAQFELAVTVDTLAARAAWAADLEAEVPALSGPGGALAIRGGRHPLLLARGVDAVPFDLILDPTERTLLITGPNTGGKSVLLKATGLIVLLAQSGIVPPVAGESVLPMIDRLFVDIGDHQSLQADLSTFSAHVVAVREMLAHAGPASLVILDEIGSGTDPAEGGALAMAVLEALTRRGVLTLATTHLGALKDLATRLPGVVNGSLHFDAATLSPSYRFTKGIPGRSYGLAIARRLGVDADVLAAAEALVPEAERQLDRLLAAVESRSEVLSGREANLAARESEVERREAVATTTAADQATREATLATREKEAERDQARRAKAYLLEARKRVDEALALARGAVDEAAAREARRLVEEGVRREAAALDEPVAPSGDTGARLAVGDPVRLSTGATGELAELRGDGRAVVQVGSMRLVVKRDSLQGLAPGQRPRSRPAAPVRVDEPARDAAWEVDLRGLRADEAEAAVLAAVDGAVLAEQPHLSIIHGMGTGVLRDVVRQLLGADPRIAAFDFAPRAQGGTGVTIAVLR